MYNWYQRWFNSPYYNIVYNHRNINDAKILIDLLIANSQLTLGSKVLDAACGNGRHSLLLFTNGFNVFGFDLSKQLINKAKLLLKKNNYSPNLIIADMRNVTFTQCFDAVFNLFTSFGYFQNDEDNFSFIKNSFQFIKPGGWFFFDYFNSNYLKNNLIPFSSKSNKNVKIIEERGIKEKRLIKKIKIETKNKTLNFTESVAFYSPDEILGKFHEIGFRLFKLFGDYKGQGFDLKNSERLIAIFRKID